MRSITQTNDQYSFTKIIAEKEKNKQTCLETLLSTSLWEKLNMFMSDWKKAQMSGHVKTSQGPQKPHGPKRVNIKMFPLSFSIHSLRVGLFKKYNASSFCTERKPPAIIFKTTESNRKTHPHQKSQRQRSMCHYLRLSIFQQGTFKFLSFGFQRHMTGIFTQATELAGLS